jgi:hypothetical protein
MEELMQATGIRLIKELKNQVLDTMQGIDECKANGSGCTYREIQDLAGLSLDLPAQDGWLTWSILSSLNQDGKVEIIHRGKSRRLYWRLRE